MEVIHKCGKWYELFEVISEEEAIDSCEFIVFSLMGTKWVEGDLCPRCFTKLERDDF